MKERSTYLGIIKAESTPVGVDWQMIRVAKEIARWKKDSQKQVTTSVNLNELKEQTVCTF